MDYAFGFGRECFPITKRQNFFFSHVHNPLIQVIQFGQRLIFLRKRKTHEHLERKLEFRHEHLARGILDILSLNYKKYLVKKSQWYLEFQ